MEKIKYEIYTRPEHTSWVVLVHGAGGSAKTFGRQIATFSKHFNLLIPDLRDHGRSNAMETLDSDDFSLDLVAKDVLDLMDDLGIKNAHFMGISLGSIIIRMIEQQAPDRILSIVIGGGVLKFNTRTTLLFNTAVFLSRYISYYRLYSIVAWILMPRANHKVARRLFARESKKINRKAFRIWLTIVARLKGQLDHMFTQPFKRPALMIMGGQDFAFLGDSHEFSRRFPESLLSIIPACGHLCNLERPSEFNDRSLNFFLAVETT
ncbi:hypothetical protein ACH42_07705 [Endozoicomonas sp. (ex Bugula neritina AB1)]|nr:hypothetical protein ACH42_07705 [Endozoicomonas sp. (ex Bugula neritina AB1)]